MKRKKAGDMIIEFNAMSHCWIVYLIADAGFCLINIEKFRADTKQECEEWLQKYMVQFKNKQNNLKKE